VTDQKQNPFEESVDIDVSPAGQSHQPESAEGPADAASAKFGDGGEPDDLSEALVKAEEDLARHRDAMLRMQAETENMKKRLIRDLDKSRKFALERIMKDLLQVRDSMERGIQVEGEALSVDALKQGQELTLKMLGKVMEDHDLKVIDPLGQPFDPEFHQAMTVMPSADVDENTVIEVLQKGFSLHDRLIRPAMVVVSRKP